MNGARALALLDATGLFAVTAVVAHRTRCQHCALRVMLVLFLASALDILVRLP